MNRSTFLCINTLAALLVLGGGAVRAQYVAPVIEWEKSYGGSSREEAESIQQTYDGGYVIGGIAESNDGDVIGHHGGRNNNEDYWVVKVDAMGNLKWQKPLGGTGPDRIGKTWQTRDGGYFAIGYSSTADGDVSGSWNASDDYWIVKLDSSRSIEWNKHFGGAGNDQPFSGQQTTDGGYIIAGRTASFEGDLTGLRIGNGVLDFWIVKLNSAGFMQWSQCYGGILNDEAHCIVQTRDGGYIIAGETSSTDGEALGNHGSVDVLIIKIDALGQIQWRKCYGGRQAEQVSNIVSTDDGGYVFAGSTYSSEGDIKINKGAMDAWVVRIDSMGSIKWTETIGGTGDDEASFVVPTSNGGYFVAGSSSSKDGDVAGDQRGGGWIFALDSSGSLVWQRKLGGSGVDYFNCIQQTADSGIIVAGYSDSQDGDVTGNHGDNDYWVVKLRFHPNISTQQEIVFHSLHCTPQSTDTLYLHNTGSKSLVIDSATYSAYNNTDFFLNTGVMPITIASGDSAAVVIVFAPRSAGSFQSTLNVFSNDTAHSPWPITITARKDSIGFALSEIKNDTIDFGYINCGATKDSAFVLTSTSTIGTTFSLKHSTSDFVVAPGVFVDSGATKSVQVHFAGSNQAKRFLDSLTLTDTCGRTSTVFLTASVDAPAFAITSFADTTLCPTDSLVSSVSVKNISHITQPLQLSGSAPLFSATPNNLMINAGDSARIQIVFHGSSSVGAFSASYDLVDNCGGTHPFAISIHVDTSHIVVPFALDSTICPQTPIVFTLPIANNDAASRVILLTSSSWSLSQQRITLHAGQRDSIAVTFPGGAVGNYSNAIHVTDDCGGNHDVVLNVIVQKQPPLQLSIQTDPIATMIGTERKVFLRADPIAALSTGVTFDIVNEPTALEFDSIATPCNIIPTVGRNTVFLALGNCPLLQSDTIAVLYYRTLVGSTLSPQVTLQNVQTSNACNTVTSNQQPATINLLPPGCELGTVVVHPYTSAIQSIYPIPATGTTTITYSTVEDAVVNVNVCDALGRVVRPLVNEVQKPGEYTTECDTKGWNSGVFYVTMRAGSYSATRELFIMR